MTFIEKQKENISKLLELVKENPELEIVPMVDSEIVCDDGFSRWLGCWGKPWVDERYDNDEKIYFRSISEDSLVEDLMDEDESLDEFNAQLIVGAYGWEKVIVVNIDLP